MPTAVEIADNVTGFSGPGTLYKIDPPIKGTEHLVVFYQPPMFGQQGRLNVVLATDSGTVFGGDVRPQQGSYVTDEPNHYLALQLAGGYVIVDHEPGVDENEIVVQQLPAPIGEVGVDG